MRYHFHSMLTYVSRYQDAKEVKRLAFQHIRDNKLTGVVPSFKSRSADEIKQSRLKDIVNNKNRQ